MKFWQSLAFVEIDQVFELTRFCEELGFYGVSFADHLVTTKQQADEYLYRNDGNIFWNPKTHWPDPWSLASALAQHSSQLKFLSTIYILPLRDPFTVAKAVSTAACLSNDRVVLGVGVGWQKAEFEMMGQDFHTRGKRADEQLSFIPDLMSGEMTEFHGEHYDFPPLQMSPGTKKPVPIMVGGLSPAAMRRAARNDGWMATTHDEQDIYPLVEQFKAIREEHGDAGKPFDIWSGVINAQPGAFDRLEEAGVTMTNGTNFLDENGRAQETTIDDKKRRLEAFAETFLS